MVGLWNFELILIDWILRLEVYFVLEILGEPQVVLVDAKSVLVFAQVIQITSWNFSGTCR